MDTIKLRYEITNADATKMTDPSRYLILIDSSENTKEFKFPDSLAKKYTNIHLREPKNRRK